ncbi:hypothetical protein Tco_0772431 [Tanacetum coccineum]|uniref:Uncharacterized protein n=1 Tax=Tanacetum coccineum TaxID=301880 RepID=A0ABQ4ZIS8_9ASTR
MRSATACADSPTHQSPGYIPESDPEEDLEEDDEEDPEEDPADYPADRGDDDDEPSSCEPAAVALFILPDPYILIAPRLDVHPNQAPTPFLSRGNTLSTIYLTITHLAQLMLRISVIPDLAGIRRRDALPSHVHDTEIPEMWLPLPRADLYGFSDMLDATPGCQMSRELGYGIRDTWDDLVGAIQDIATNHPKRGSTRRVIEDRPFHRRTALLMEEEARVSRAAWAQSMDACDQVRSKGISLWITDIAQQSEITELLAADRRRQTMIKLQRQQGPAKDPAEPELPEEASSSS